ncbi:unnamed protein product [Paramecium pentaurelia]|uniref:RING-type domain-containing protein n=1 Tax=Paramecium pentaurelia TaxID=43138 RepID=A0A8S1TXC1_9CILI|nr:unnamed protein product [Paramecium pentaurelia]
MSQQEDDDMKLLSCSNCGEYYPNCGIIEHLQSCLLEGPQVDCRFCGEIIFQKKIQQHQQNCKAFAFQEQEDDVCEFCQEKIFKQFKQDHYLDCPLKQVADTYQFQSTHECSICLIDIGPLDEKGILQCCHIFHQKCLQGWQQKSKECPVCRYN